MNVIFTAIIPCGSSATLHHPDGHISRNLVVSLFCKKKVLTFEPGRKS